MMFLAGFICGALTLFASLMFVAYNVQKNKEKEIIERKNKDV